MRLPTDDEYTTAHCVARACLNYRAAREAAERLPRYIELLHELFLLAGAPAEPMDATERMLRFNRMRGAVHRALEQHFNAGNPHTTL